MWVTNQELSGSYGTRHSTCFGGAFLMFNQYPLTNEPY